MRAMKRLVIGFLGLFIVGVGKRYNECLTHGEFSMYWAEEIKKLDGSSFY